MNKQFGINGRKIILLEFQMILYMKLLSDLIPAFKILEVVFDFLNILLVVFIFKAYKHSRTSVKKIGAFILLLLLYCFLSFFMFKPHLVLFFWGLRNKFRFLIAFLGTAIFLKKEDVNRLFNMMYICLLINMPIITFQFISGVGRDYLGGTFGIQKNCNASTNVLLIALCAYFFISKLKKNEKTKKFVTVLLCSVYWAILSELKVFFVELIIVVILSILIVNGKAMSKIKWFSLLGAMFVLGAIGLYYVYPEQAEFIFNPKSIIWYLRNVHGGAYGFGRTTALTMISDLFFNHDFFKVLFGIGVGNAEFLDVLGLHYFSDFYVNYHEYSYFGYFHSMIYLEMGILGILWYVLFWLRGFRDSIKYKYFDSKLMTFSTVYFVCTLINAFKDSTLLISVSGYISFILLAIPFVCINRFNLVSDIDE